VQVSDELVFIKPSGIDAFYLRFALPFRGSLPHYFKREKLSLQINYLQYQPLAANGSQPS
jgi:hypothetical protein